MKKFLWVFLLVFCGAPTIPAFGQVMHPKTKPFTLGVVDGFYSSILGENRTLNVFLPDGYDTAKSKAYPVIYLLDGSAGEDYVHVCGLVQFLTMIKAMPQSIVVGIANVDRRRDFTFPTTVEKDKIDNPTTGGSQKFIRFLERELQPYLEKNYRVSSSKTIIGQSLGGLLATEVLLKRPTLFNTYIIVSPSLWWNRVSLLEEATRLLKMVPESPMSVYVSVGAEGKEMIEPAKSLVRLLEKPERKTVKVIYNYMPEETHLTILHNSLYQAFQKLYANFNKTDEK